MLRGHHTLVNPSSNHQSNTLKVNKRSKNFDGRSHRAGASPKNAPSVGRGDSGPIVLSAHTRQRPTRHLDRFCRFGRAHVCVQQTDRNTHRPRNIGNNRPHLCALCMRRGEKKIITAHCLYKGYQRRNLVSYLCQLVFAAILWVKLLALLAG